MKKILKIFLIILIIVSLGTIQFVSKATFQINSADLYSKGKCGAFLKFKDIIVNNTYIVYGVDGKEYPAYCIEREKPGVEEAGAYTVLINGIENNALLWRTIINGFPYKSAAELGCANHLEAYTATKQAVYCILYGNDYNNFELYSPINEAGERTLNALKLIVNTARNNSYSQLTSNLNIQTIDNEWKTDDNGNIYKTYTLNSNANIESYNISLSENIKDLALITNENNIIKNNFLKDEKFRILLPIKLINTDINFNIIAKANVYTKPVLYGKAPNTSVQNYLLTGKMYEQGEGIKAETCSKNNTKIIITKQDLATQEKIAGTEFNLLDKNKNIVFSNLKTDINGKIELNSMIPGKYFLIESIAANNYIKTEEEIEINLDLNEEVVITVNNSKENKKEIEIKQENININVKHVSNINIKSALSETNIISEKQDTNIDIVNENINTNNIDINTNINNTNTNENINDIEINTNINNTNKNINSNVIKVNNNIKKLPLTGM